MHLPRIRARLRRHVRRHWVAADPEPQPGHLDQLERRRRRDAAEGVATDDGQWLLTDDDQETSP